MEFELDTDAIYEQGYDAWTAGDLREDCPYSPKSTAALAWLDGWDFRQTACDEQGGCDGRDSYGAAKDGL